MKQEKDETLKKTEEQDGIHFEPLGNEAETQEKQSGIQTEEGQSGRKREKGGGKKIAAILLSIVLVAVIGSYVGIAIHYKSHFLPNTSINNIDCSELDAAQVAGLLENQLQNYSLEVRGRDCRTAASGAVLGRIAASDIALTYADNTRLIVEQLLEQQNEFFWLYRYFSQDAFGTSIAQGVSYDETLLEELTGSWEACQVENMIPPEDAYISEYSEKIKGYEIVPETIGTKFQTSQLQELIAVAILAQETVLDIEAAGCYEEAKISSQNTELTKIVSDANRMLGTQITYDWNGTEVILDVELLKEWVSIENHKAVLDEDAVEAFVKEQAENCDTYGKPRRFLTTLGIELTLPSGYYGWQTDKKTETEELLKLIYAGRVEKREPVYSSTAKKKGMSDIGSSYVEADLTHQHLYLYQDGKIVFETDFVSGSMSSTPDCVTPQGVFGLTYKTTNAVLRGANYETPVNYWMPFYGNYGMHDATWRNQFGGDIYISNGSHGCINLPLDSAATIYEYVSTGFPVICYYYSVDPLAVKTEPENIETQESPEE